MNKDKILKLLRIVAIFGDVLFIMWVAYNAFDEGFHGVGLVQAVALSGLILLLILNITLLSKK